MKKIIYCGYRDWALEVYDEVRGRFSSNIDFVLMKDHETFLSRVDLEKPDLVFFIGWSWILPKEIVLKHTCICLHPSPLPKYRGGSPIQNQIVRGEKESAVTFFVMDEFIDKGPIVWQRVFSLAGDLQDVLDRITQLGKEGLKEILEGYVATGTIPQTPQDHSQSSYFKRRTPDQSEIKLEDFKNFTAEELYDKVRALQDPYPNAYVVCKDNTVLYFQHVKPGDAS